MAVRVSGRGLSGLDIRPDEGNKYVFNFAKFFKYVSVNARVVSMHPPP